MKKNRYFKISEDESLDLHNPQEKFKALTWVCTNEHYFRIDSYLMSVITNKGLDKFLDSEDYNRTKLREAVLGVFNLFNVSIHSNFLSQYLLDYDQENDLVKKSRLNQLLIGLISYIDHHWEQGASIIDYSIKKKDKPINEDNLTELHMFYYLMYGNLKNIYDLIWDYFSVFVDKEQFVFSYSYSNKINPQKENQIKEQLKLNTEDNFLLSRDDILEKLINKGESLLIYSNYEKRLISEGFINQDRDKWLKDASSLIRFYNYCEEKNIFKSFLKDNSKGVRYIRELYSFNDGTGIDSPSKRLKQKTKKQKYQFSFLNILTLILTLVVHL